MHSALSRRWFAGALAATLVSVGYLGATSAHAAGTSSVSGTVWNDANRNGAVDASESAESGLVMYLYDDATNTFVDSATTDTSGHYTFSGLADGAYRVQISASSWSPMQHNWVPTTTGGTLAPVVHVSVSGTVTVNLGLRAIVRSSTAGSPISSYTATSGLVVESYDDAVTAQQVFNALQAGALVGAEAGTVTIRFDLCANGVTTYGAQWAAGQWSNYAAVSCVAYDQWLNNGDTTLFHEYGHAWSMYYAYIAQQDATLAGYLQARGLSGDARVDSSYMWDRHEMIAEDYRELFGTANAQLAPQMNTDIPPAASVPGLKTYLASTFRAASSTSGSRTTTSTTPLGVSNLSVSPQPVSKSGTVSFSLSAAASVTVSIVNAKGGLVRTLLSGTAEGAGGVNVVWDRRDAAGNRVKSGTYTATVKATDSMGSSQSAQTAFSVQ